MHDSALPNGDAADTEPAALTVPQTARKLAISERRVWLLIKTGELVSYKEGTARRVPAAAVNARIASKLREEGFEPAEVTAA